MASSVENEPKKGFDEKVWSYAVWGTVLVVVIAAAIQFLGPQISTLEKTLNFASLT